MSTDAVTADVSRLLALCRSAGIPDRDAMLALGRDIGVTARAGDVVILDGPLGAGKTTLTQGIAAGLGVRGPVTSPTFVLSRVHPSVTGGPALVHVDAYRLDSAAEVDDLDLDMSQADAVTVVEWGEGKVGALSDARLVVRISFDPTNDGARHVEISCEGEAI